MKIIQIHCNVIGEIFANDDYPFTFSYDNKKTPVHSPDETENFIALLWKGLCGRPCKIRYRAGNVDCSIMINDYELATRNNTKTKLSESHETWQLLEHPTYQSIEQVTRYKTLKKNASSFYGINFNGDRCRLAHIRLIESNHFRLVIKSIDDELCDIILGIIFTNLYGWGKQSGW